LLPSFEVENFRTFSHLRIPHLSGVNLIVGRNNVGKSMLLEALRLYAAEGDINAILGLLYDRDELLPSPDVEPQQQSFQVRFASLFHGRSLPDTNKPAIVLQRTLKMLTAFK
jgi:predicted ATP-dependent endonuclease of OLD family